MAPTGGFCRTKRSLKPRACWNKILVSFVAILLQGCVSVQSRRVAQLGSGFSTSSSSGGGGKTEAVTARRIRVSSVRRGLVGVGSSSSSDGGKVSSALRINCGGGAIRDGYGRRWRADGPKYALQGSGFKSPPGQMSLLALYPTAVSALYENSRVISLQAAAVGSGQTNSTSAATAVAGSNATSFIPVYRLPCEGNVRYFLRLHFASLAQGFSESDAFDIAVNGFTLTVAFSPPTADTSPPGAVQLEFLLPVFPTTSMTLSLKLRHTSAFISAIELVNTERPLAAPSSLQGVASPSSSSSAPPPPVAFLESSSSGAYGPLAPPDAALRTLFRINCGGNEVPPASDVLGRQWLRDSGFESSGGQTEVAVTKGGLGNVDAAPSWLPAAVFKSQRGVRGGVGEGIGSSGELLKLDYELPVGKSSELLVRLHFAEFAPSTASSSSSSAAPLFFDVLLNSVPIKMRLNVSRAAGGYNMAMFVDATIFLPSQPRPLSISLLSTSAAALSGIEVLKIIRPFSQLHPPAPPPSSPPPAFFAPFTPSFPLGPTPPASVAASALLNFKQGLGDPAALSSWVGEPCTTDETWTGVGCNGTDVVAVVLPMMGLEGPLTPQLGDLAALKAVWLEGNMLTGAIPSNVGLLRRLESLRLGGNSLSGNVPQEIGQLGVLQELMLSGNNLTGPLPSEVLQMPLVQQASASSDSPLQLSPGNPTLCLPPPLSPASYPIGLPKCTKEQLVPSFVPPPAPPLPSPPFSMANSPFPQNSSSPSTGTAPNLPESNGSAVFPSSLPPPSLPPGPPSGAEDQTKSSSDGGSGPPTTLAWGLGATAAIASLLSCAVLGFCFGMRKRRALATVGAKEEEEEEEEQGMVAGVAGRKAAADEETKIDETQAMLLSLTRKLSSQASKSGNLLNRSFTFAELQKACQNFADEKFLGGGGFGKVYKGELEDGTIVAVKRHIAGSGQGTEQFFMELSVLSKVRHRHLVSLIGYCHERKEMLLVYEYMPKGTLREHICDPSLPPLTWRQRLQVAVGAAKGLEYLHQGLSPAVIHRDVKSTNILLDSNFSAKVGDFGLSRDGPHVDETHVSTAVRGSFGYVDPEYYKWLKLTDKSDVYSFGVVLLELLAGRKVIDLSLPYESNEANLVEYSRGYLPHGKALQLADKRLERLFCPESLQHVGHLVLQMLQEPGSLRPSMEGVRQSLEAALRMEEEYWAAKKL